MALSVITLESAMLAIDPTEDAAVAATNFAVAYGTYIKEATCGGIPAVGAFIDATCVPAMAAALVFSDDAAGSAGAATLVGGYQAFWAPAVSAPASLFPGVSAITPPTMAGLDTLLENDFTANLVATKAAAIANLATSVHAASAGGLGVIAAVPTPII